MEPLDPLEWRYEMRREMQEILPGLFLGPYAVSRSRAELQGHNITHLLLLIDPKETHLFRPLFPKDFHYSSITVEDTESSNVIGIFPQFRDTVNRILAERGRLLVYCRDGISRAPTFVVAYVMETFNMDFKHAIDYVQNRRFCMNPNEGFRTQLLEYEPIFQARQAYQSVDSQQLRQDHFASKKRPKEQGGEGDDEDTDMQLESNKQGRVE
ncbi:hypothetical protein RI367_002809 [Sorochytrium milnesiophthora]